MSLRRHVLRVVALATAVAMVFAAFAGSASAKKMSPKQKAHVRSELRKQIKKNPRAIKSRSFLRRAALVNFVLPVTIKLDGSSPTANPNKATIDLGASLGKRSIYLGGRIPAEIQFADSYDGGALGNVKLNLTQGAGALTTSSIPLLWNKDVTSQGYGTTLNPGLGCQGFNGASPLGYEPVLNAPGGTPIATLGATANSGPPYNFTTNPAFAALQAMPGYPVIPGVDSIANVNGGTSATAPGNLYAVGSTTPFPSGIGDPYNASGQPTAQDTVLRTGPLTLGIANAGTNVDLSTGLGTGSQTAAQGSDIVSIGASGGEANLFGKIPGKNSSIDVTLNLATQINSILREVNANGQRLQDNTYWPSAALNCRQAWSGYVDNYIPGVRLQGDLKISPAINANGDLRIAKVKLKTQENSIAVKQSARIALAACLTPDQTFAAQTSLLRTGTTAGAVKVPVPPINPATNGAAPTVACNSGPTDQVRSGNVGVLGLPNAGDFPNASAIAADGSRVSVAGDLTVDNVDAEVIIGDR